ncbi:hypothetical protein LJR289_003495 [Pseudoduganella sp. LjRoot289]|uniref:hypothetical protein n=1 Tax=Pseudoduganella sp. LjRoot289 TaxID=3342314 RepID=UPI003ECDCD87
MEDLKDPVAASPAALTPASHPAPPSGPSPRKRRRGVTVLLYLLAAFGLLFLGIFAYGAYRASLKVERVTIDEAAVIDSVMSSNYGKYSIAKKGWLYVGEDNRTYLMRVVQQVKMADSTEGDELYFLASGQAVDGEGVAVFGAFHIRPNSPSDGGLAEISNAVMHAGTRAVKPEDVRFEALSEELWGWVVKVRDGEDPQGSQRVVTRNLVLASHDNQIATLADFLAGAEFDPGIPCAEAKANYERYAAGPAAGAQGAEEEPEEPLRCEKRRWSYRTAGVNGKIPVPFTVTVGGTLDGEPVEAKSWKLMFDTKSFSYNVPEELKN